LCSQPSRRYCPTKIQHPRHLAINGTNADATLDQYATTDSYATNDYGGFTFSHRQQRFLQVYRHRQKRQQLRLHGKLR
jgi:hypothetical protein